MAKSMFKGRSEQLSILDAQWERDDAALVVVHGRRRVGKTRLLTHWRSQHPDEALYWVAEPMSALDQLRSFSQSLHNFLYPHAPAGVEVTYNSWEQAFWYVAEIAKQKRFALFIDEFTYLLEVDSTIAGTLQKAWDQWLSDSNLMLALSGSQKALMEKYVLSYQSPLYGRNNIQIELKPLPYGITPGFFPHYSAEDRVSLYSIFGGIPAYWERMDEKKPLMDNVKSQLLEFNTLMQDEPKILLNDYITDLYNYVGIMQAIARGERSNARISSRTGLPKGHISKYLGVLRDTGFVARHVPVTENEDSRRGHYFVTDPYLRFYYRFMATHQAQLAIGSSQQAVLQIQEQLPEFIEANTWQEIATEWVTRASANGRIPFHLDKIGSVWNRSYTIPVAGINTKERIILLGCTSWLKNLANDTLLQQLVHNASQVIPEGKKWSVYFIGFAKKGWNSTAHNLVQELVESQMSIDNWKFLGFELLDLETIDHDLVTWTNEGRK